MIKFDDGKLNDISIPREAAERLIKLPKECARVYVYGLLRREADLDQLMSELELSRNDVISAFDDLIDAKLLETDVAGGYAYLVPEKEEELENSPVYRNAEFNMTLQQYFGDRNLTFENYKSIYNAMELNGLSFDVMLMLCEYAIENNKAKNRISMKLISSLAKAWGKEGVITIGDAERKIASLKNSGSAQEILTLLGIRRLPTDEEQTLFLKWTEEMGFNMDAIKEAMPATTGAQYPTMRYLDGILKSLYAAGNVSAEDVRRAITEGTKTDDAIKALLRRLPTGHKGVTDRLRAMYWKWRRMGFTEGEMALGAEETERHGAASMEYLDRLLTDWATRGLTRKADIEKHLEKERKKRDDVREMLSRAGIKKAVTEADIAAWERFTEGFALPKEVVLFAAEQAYGMKMPVRAMETILVAWKREGVKDVAGAKEASARHRESAAASSKQPARFLERGGDEISQTGFDPTE